MWSRSKQLAVLLIITGLTACTSAGPAAPAPHPPGHLTPAHGPSPLMIGVYEPYAPGSYWQIPRFAAAIGRWPQIVSYYSQWGMPFAAHFAAEVRKNGGEVLIQIDPRNVSVASIAAGQQDPYILRYAAAVRQFRHRVIISFGQEMNGSWYPWGWKNVSPAVFVAAWRHIVRLFRRHETRNVTWLWDVNHHYPRGMAPLAADWPGARYVDWVGLDSYLFGDNSTYASVIAPDVLRIRALTGKPILLAETAVGAYLPDEPGKIRDLLAGVRRDHLLGLVWFDVRENGMGLAHQDWRLEDNPAAIAAFKAGIRS